MENWRRNGIPLFLSARASPPTIHSLWMPKKLLPAETPRRGKRFQPGVKRNGSPGTKPKTNHSPKGRRTAPPPFQPSNPTFNFFPSETHVFPPPPSPQNTPLLFPLRASVSQRLCVSFPSHDLQPASPQKPTVHYQPKFGTSQRNPLAFFSLFFAFCAFFAAENPRAHSRKR